MRVEEVGDVRDDDYIVNNIGKGKRFPGNLEYTYRGKTTPYMHTWSTKESMTSEILKNVVENLDTLRIFDGSTGISPVLLLDGHVSR